MAPPIEEVIGGDVAGRARAARHRFEGTLEDLLPPLCADRRPFAQRTVGVEQRIRKKIELEHVGHQSVEQQWIGLGTVELVDDDVASELAQRVEASVTAVGSRETDPSQVGNIERIEVPIVRMRGEEGVRDVNAAGTDRQTGNEEARVRDALVVAGVATDRQRSRRLAKDERRVEGHVAECDECRLAFVDAALRHIQDLAGARELLVDVMSRR